MSTIHVLQVRFRNDDSQPWRYEVETITCDHEPHDDWQPAKRPGSLIRQWEERVLPYVRQERHPGSEPPDDARVVFTRDEHGWPRLVYYMHVTNSWHYAEPGASGEAIKPPGFWFDLPLDLGRSASIDADATTA